MLARHEAFINSTMVVVRHVGLKKKNAIYTEEPPQLKNDQ